MLPLPDDEGGCDKEMDRIRVLLTLLTTDYNPDSLCMRRVVGVFNNEGGCGGGDDDGGGKGVGYLRALGTVGRRVVDMGFVEWEDSIVEESNGELPTTTANPGVSSSLVCPSPSPSSSGPSSGLLRSRWSRSI